MRAYLFGVAVTVLLGAGYLEWFAHRERHSRRDLARLEQFESEPEA
jgi:hypothetical protein